MLHERELTKLSVASLEKTCGYVMNDSFPRKKRCKAQAIVTFLHEPDAYLFRCYEHQELLAPGQPHRSNVTYSVWKKR